MVYIYIYIIHIFYNVTQVKKTWINQVLSVNISTIKEGRRKFTNDKAPTNALVQHLIYEVVYVILQKVNKYTISSKIWNLKDPLKVTYFVWMYKIG